MTRDGRWRKAARPLPAASQGPSGPHGRSSSRPSAPDGGVSGHEGNENRPEGRPPQRLVTSGAPSPAAASPAGCASSQRRCGTGAAGGVTGGAHGGLSCGLRVTDMQSPVPTSQRPHCPGPEDTRLPSPTPDSPVPSDARIRGCSSPLHEVARVLPKTHAQPPECFVLFYLLRH